MELKLAHHFSFLHHFSHISPHFAVEDGHGKHLLALAVSPDVLHPKARIAAASTSAWKPVSSLALLGRHLFFAGLRGIGSGTSSCRHLPVSCTDRSLEPGTRNQV
jgi:hypothetical protein